MVVVKTIYGQVENARGFKAVGYTDLTSVGTGTGLVRSPSQKQIFVNIEEDSLMKAALQRASESVSVEDAEREVLILVNASISAPHTIATRVVLLDRISIVLLAAQRLLTFYLTAVILRLRRQSSYYRCRLCGPQNHFRSV